MWRDLCRSKPLNQKELQWYLKKQLIIFTILNTTFSFINLYVQDNSAIEEGAIIVSLMLLYAALPLGAWGVWRENSGITALYVVFGILCGAGRTVLSIAASVTVALSCQAEQLSFKGCTIAVDALPCLKYSSCTRDMLDTYNSFKEVTNCDAWGIDDCKNSPATLTSLAFLGGKLVLLLLNIFTSCLPVYFAVLYFTRLDNDRRAKEFNSNPDSDSDDNSPDEVIPKNKKKAEKLEEA